jgi:hypothetical protein
MSGSLPSFVFSELEGHTMTEINNMYQKHAGFFNARGVNSGKELIEIIKWRFKMKYQCTGRNGKNRRMDFSPGFTVDFLQNNFWGYALVLDKNDKLDDIIGARNFNGRMTFAALYAIVTSEFDTNTFTSYMQDKGLTDLTKQLCEDGMVINSRDAVALYKDNNYACVTYIYVRTSFVLPDFPDEKRVEDMHYHDLRATSFSRVTTVITKILRRIDVEKCVTCIWNAPVNYFGRDRDDESTIVFYDECYENNHNHKQVVYDPFTGRLCIMMDKEIDKSHELMLARTIEAHQKYVDMIHGAEIPRENADKLCYPTPYTTAMTTDTVKISASETNNRQRTFVKYNYDGNFTSDSQAMKYNDTVKYESNACMPSARATTLIFYPVKVIISALRPYKIANMDQIHGFCKRINENKHEVPFDNVDEICHLLQMMKRQNIIYKYPQNDNKTKLVFDIEEIMGKD